MKIHHNSRGARPGSTSVKIASERGHTENEALDISDSMRQGIPVKAELDMLCWCGKKMKKMPRELLDNNTTFSCGRKGCNEDSDEG